MNSSIYYPFEMQLGAQQVYQLKNFISPEMAQNCGYYSKMFPYQNFQTIDDPKLILKKDWYFNNKNQLKVNLKNPIENKSENDSPAKSTNEDSKDSPKENKNNERNDTSNNINSNTFKEEYMDLLINSINKLFKEGTITMDYINSPSFDPKKLGITLSNLNKLTDETENNFNKK